MIAESEYKVPGGKLIRVKLELDGNNIKKIMITGDFFMYPEEALEDLEKLLMGVELNWEKINLMISSFLKRNSVEVLGATASDFTKAIIKAVKGQVK